MEPRQTWSYHTHNLFCDGEGTVEEVVQAAIAANLTEIGISSHAPLPFRTEWNMPAERLQEYVRTVREVQDRYQDRIRVLLGAELDFIPDSRVIDFQQREIFPLAFDYFVGSVHFLGRSYPTPSFDDDEEGFRAILQGEYTNDVEAMVTDFYRRVREMVKLPRMRIVGHLDRIKKWNGKRAYFAGDEAWYVAAVDETLRAIAASGKIVELNTAGWRQQIGEPYPAPWILKSCRRYDIPVTVSSDSHRPVDVTLGFDRGLACLAELGMTPQPL